MACLRREEKMNFHIDIFCVLLGTCYICGLFWNRVRDLRERVRQPLCVYFIDFQAQHTHACTGWDRRWRELVANGEREKGRLYCAKAQNCWVLYSDGARSMLPTKSSSRDGKVPARGISQSLGKPTNQPTSICVPMYCTLDEMDDPSSYYTN